MVSAATMATTAATATQADENPVREEPLPDAIDMYLLTLAREHRFTLQVEVDSLHIVESLKERWPKIDAGWENEALTLWRMIDDLARPLIDITKADYTRLTLTVGVGLKFPQVPNGMAVWASFDAVHSVLRHHMISSGEADPDMQGMIAAGMVLLCQPVTHQSYAQGITSEHKQERYEPIITWTRRALDTISDEEKAAKDRRHRAELAKLRTSMALYLAELEAGRELDSRRAQAAPQGLQTKMQPGMQPALQPSAQKKPETVDAGISPPTTAGSHIPASMLTTIETSVGARNALGAPMPRPAQNVETHLLAIGAAAEFPPALRATARNMAQELRDFHSPATLENAVSHSTAHIPTHTAEYGPEPMHSSAGAAHENTPLENPAHEIAHAGIEAAHNQAPHVTHDVPHAGPEAHPAAAHPATEAHSSSAPHVEAAHTASSPGHAAGSTPSHSIASHEASHASTSAHTEPHADAAAHSVTHSLRAAEEEVETSHVSHSEHCPHSAPADDQERARQRREAQEKREMTRYWREQDQRQERELAFERKIHEGNGKQSRDNISKLSAGFNQTHTPYHRMASPAAAVHAGPSFAPSFTAAVPHALHIATAAGIAKPVVAARASFSLTQKIFGWFSFGKAAQGIHSPSPATKPAMNPAPVRTAATRAALAQALTAKSGAAKPAAAKATAVKPPAAKPATTPQAAPKPASKPALKPEVKPAAKAAPKPPEAKIISHPVVAGGGGVVFGHLHRPMPHGPNTVELSTEELKDIDSAAAKITVQGARYPEKLEQLTGR